MSFEKKVLVIGSNSFSGACFSSYALKQGAHVIGMSRSDEPNRVFLPYRWMGKDERFKFYPYDINHHQDEIMKVVNRDKPSLIVNFAAQSMVGQSWERPEDWFRTNAVSTVMLHNKLRWCDFIDRYVHVTTPEVYGSTDGFIDEETPFNPSTPYAVSRAAADMSLKTFVEAYGFPAISTRAANVYGPGQQLYRIIPRAILYFRLGKRLQLHGGGLSCRSFIHMDDVSSATWSLMDGGRVGETYHISTNEVVTIRELVERICRKMDLRFEDCVEVVGDRLGKDAAYLLDSSKIRSELGWKDSINLDVGLDQCISWVDQNLDVLKAQSFDYVHKS
ncbi:GDP-mannose 4,6-dehydratase [Thalassospira alkalitolerans]|uniref:dTDP-glucose 4,6-dehydratase n=1 Tax=Thalassospira alkalitolerans TaxID=1293890 RepID=A0A1Y2LGL7_9PROT|nr:GDP-mannose 4,6-dehydratase [Thalassospira alkalitolerans]OSQ50085.1 dTDP-glucose 4,6-dehydratase [Thalassospira alkalitolerans]